MTVKNMTKPEDMAVGNNGGLTKREYFAIKILQGLMSRTHMAEAKTAVDYADKLIEELNKNKR